MAVLQIWNGSAWVKIFGGSPSTHTSLSHSDVNVATGPNLDTLVDGSDADELHAHPKIKSFAVAMAIALG